MSEFVDDGEMWQISEMLIVIQVIADDKLVWHDEASVVCKVVMLQGNINRPHDAHIL